MKKLFSIITLIIISQNVYTQIIFQDKFNTLTLSTYTTAYTTTQYTSVPSGYIEVSEGYKNAYGSGLNPNAPFHTDSLKNKGWGIVYNDVLKDTFLVSTSWIDTTNKPVSRWVLLPVINGIAVNSVLHWQAMAPDPAYADGYAVYISTNTSSTDTSIFTTANKVFQLSDNSVSGGGEKQQWTTRSISLSNYAGQSIRIAFKNTSHQKYQLWIDDITIENLSYALDASLENTGNTKYVLINQPFQLKARLKNNGYQNISNCNIAYSIQGITYNNQSFSITNNLLPLNTTTIAFTNTISVNTAGMYKVKIWINQVNGQTDQNHFNDTVSYYLSVMSNSVQPKIIIEQITDATMPNAPANQDTLMSLSQQDTNIVAVQIHQQDSLKCNISASHSKYFSVPEKQLVSMINRNYFYSSEKNYSFVNELRKKINDLKNSITPCKINISNVLLNTSLRTLQLDINVEFYQNTVGDYRVNVYLIENNVYGNPADTSINGYNQLSSFYFTPQSNYFQQGYFSNSANAFVLNAYQYKHQLVLNQSTSGIYGDASVIPNNTIAGYIYTKTYSLSIPSATNVVSRYNFDNMYVVAYVYEHDTLIENRKILNVTKIKLTSNPEVVNVETIANNINVQIYPNPASEFILINMPKTINIKGKILNMVGQKLLSFNSELVDISMLSEGIYILMIQTEKGILSKKIIVQR